MYLILPVAGLSTRFPNVRPKFLLTHPNGHLMLTESISGIKYVQDTFKQIIIISLKEYEKKYKFSKELLKELKTVYPSIKTKILLLDKPTKNQPETISKAIEKYKLRGGIFIKDSDNYFKFDSKYKNNFVVVSDLHKLSKINASNKSYVNIGIKNTVSNIVEKKIIGNLFCCGGYYFKEAKDFLSVYKELSKTNDNLYISHIIYQMLLNKQIFFAEEATNYIDWGTLEDWMEYKKQFGTIFIDIDGTLVMNGGQHCTPKWGELGSIPENIKIINKMYDTGKIYVVLTTSRPLSPYSTYITFKQIKKYKIKYHKILFDLPHARRILINDHAKSNPYPSAIAINLERNSNKLEEMLNYEQ